MTIVFSKSSRFGTYPKGSKYIINSILHVRILKCSIITYTIMLLFRNKIIVLFNNISQGLIIIKVGENSKPTLAG